MPTATASPASETPLPTTSDHTAEPTASASPAGPPALDLLVRAGCEFIYHTDHPSPIFFTLKLQQGPLQRIEFERQHFEPAQPIHEYRDSHGNVIHRAILQPGFNTVRYDALIHVPSEVENLRGFGPTLPVDQLPTGVMRYTLPSRYCDSDRLFDFAYEKFGHVPHGAERVQAICDWVHKNIEYRMFSGSPNTTAHDIVTQGFGVCRDFAHTAIALCRTFNLPARYVTGYVSDIAFQDSGTPMDFHAYFEVYLSSGWHVFDARFNVPRVGRVKIAHGLDAVDGAFATVYGMARWQKFEVWSYQIDPADPEAASLERPVDLGKRLCGTTELVIPGR